jgi:DNA-binding CsgD family transcriptional regulator
VIAVEQLLGAVRDAHTSRTFRGRVGAILHAIGHVLPSDAAFAIAFDPKRELEPALERKGGALPPLHSPPPEHAVLVNYDHSAMQAFASYYIQFDTEGAASMQHPGRLTHIATSRIWSPMRDFLHDQRWAARVGVHLQLTAGTSFTLGFTRSDRRRPFGEREMRIVQLVVPDVERAALAALVAEGIDSRARAAGDGSAWGGALTLDARGDIRSADRGALRALAAVATTSATIGDLLREGGAVLRSSASPTLTVTWPLVTGGWLATTFARAPLDDARVVVLVRPVAAGSVEHVAATSRRAGLTARELEVANLAARGFGNREIGRALGIAALTVKVHLAATYRKLGVSGRTELARTLLGARDEAPPA